MQHSAIEIRRGRSYSRNMKHPKLLLFSVAIVTFILAACGGTAERTDTSASPSSGGSETAAAVPEVTPNVVETPEPAAPSLTESPSIATEKVEPAGEVADSGLTADEQDLMAQGLNDPELMTCLTGAVGMQTLMELVNRDPTQEETILLESCLAEEDGGFASSITGPAAESPEAGSMEEETSSEEDETASALLVEEPDEDSAISFFDRFINAQIQPRIDAAFAPTSCDGSSENNYPSSYYEGPLIDSHFHIPALDTDFDFGGDDDDGDEARGVDAELYDSIAREDQPWLGSNLNMNSVACALQREGTIKAFAFFPVYLDVQTHLLEVASRTMDAYPSLFVPFIQSSGHEASIVEPEILQEFLDLSPDLFFGLGEVGDSPTEPINPPPDSVLYTENFEVVESNGLSVVYFHNGEGHHENLGRALERFPEITFITHGDFVRPHIADLIDTYPNLYFTFNDIFDEHIPLFRFGDKQEFISNVERDWDMMLDVAIGMYQPMIEAHPDRFMWGTDRADIAWNYNEDIGILLAKYARDFIGRFDPEIQDKIAYKNAELLIANNGRS